MLELQILHGFRRLQQPAYPLAGESAPFHLSCHCLCPLVAFAWTFGSSRVSARQEQRMDVCSSRVHPSLWRLDISFHSLQSTSSNSCVLIAQRPESDARLCVHMSRIFLSNALRTARCAPSQRKMCCACASQAERCARSILTSGVWSKSAEFTNCASVRKVRNVRTSIISWYWADAWHTIIMQVFSWIICLECALHALHGIYIKTERSVLCPYVSC